MVALALLGWSTAARADRVALLPARSSDEAARAPLDVELARSLIALGHSVVPETETKTALGGIGDGVADTSEEYQAVAAATKADWVLAGSVEPAVGTQRVELVALLASQGRVESVAREVEKARSQVQTQEMLAVLLRAEGIGAGLLPWEQVSKPEAKPVPQPPKEVAPPPPPVKPSGKKVVHMDYMLGSDDVWPAYAANRRFFLGVGQGFSVAAAQPAGARGGAAAYVGHIRAGYALGDDGLELLGQLGGNLAGPRALWIEGGARWMFTPSLHVQPPSGDYYALSFHMGPELTLGGLIRLPTEVEAAGFTYEGSASGHFTLGAALALQMAITPAFRVDAQVGNFRWVPTGDGSVMLFGATLGASLRL